MVYSGLRLMRIIFVLVMSLLVCIEIYAQEDCDVNLIEVALVDVTGYRGQPNFNDSHICSVGDTIRIEFGTPGITCNPSAMLSLNEFRILIFQGFTAEQVIISGGVGGPFVSGTDYAFTSNSGGTISVDLNPGATIQMDQNNPVIFDVVLSPDCSVSDESITFPEYELDYSLPGNIPSQVTGEGLIDLRASVFEPFINIISSSTTPEVALPGEVVCREVTLVNNGQFSLLDTMSYKDFPDFPFSQITSFNIIPIESGVLSTTAIDGMPFLNSTTNVDSIEILLDGVVFGGSNRMFEVDGGVQLQYCVETQCPATVNNSALSAWYGCNDEICQVSTDLESVVVVFNGIPDLLVSRTPIIPSDPCVDPLMWEFRIVNDSIDGGALETIEGEADAQGVRATIHRNECQVFEWDSYDISIGNLDGGRDDYSATSMIQVLDDSICVTGLPDLGVNDTLIIKINLAIPSDDGSPMECEALVNQEAPSCLDPWIKVNYENRCQDGKEVEQSQPINSSFPPTEGNPMMSFREVEYSEPSYCTPGKIVFEMQNLSGLANPTTTAQDIQFYVRKEFCSTFDLINYEYGEDASTGNVTGLAVDETSIDSFYVVSIPGDIAKDASVFFSFEIALGCKDSEACVHPDAECFMPDVKATWENCYDLRWFTEYDFGYKLIDFKPAPKNGLENHGGGAGPVSFSGSGCSTRNYWYRYQFGGIDNEDCRVFLRYKVAQINADGSAGTVMSAADMAAGVGSTTGATTHSIITGIGGAPDTLVIEVESDIIESCIEDEELLINVQHASICTSSVEPVKFYESYEVIFECDNGSNCCIFNRSCYETVKDCRCGTPGPTPTCYLFCIENTEADLCRLTDGCPAPDASYASAPDPKDHALPCDTMRLTTTAQFIRQSSAPANPPCDEIEMMLAEINPGPHLDYCEGTAEFIVTSGAATMTSSCAPIPYDPVTGEFDLTSCVDWSGVMDGWSIEFVADWKVKEEVPACAEGFVMEEMEVEFKGKFIDGGNITNCGSPQTQKAEYYVGDPFLAKMIASLEFENGCEVSAAIQMFDDCGVGNKFNDYRPGYILDSIVYNISGAEFTYTAGTAVLTSKGLNGAMTYSVPSSQISIDNSNGFNITFENDGSWPEELTRSSASDSLFCLLFDLEFTECYAYSTDIVADSKIYYHSCGGCGPREIASPGGVEFNNPPEAILNCLGAPIVQTPNDDVVWNIQVGHTPSADFHWVAFDLPPSITFDQVYDNTTATDITSTGITNGSVTWFQLGSEQLNDLTLDANFTDCDTMYVPVYVGWSCNGYPDDPTTGEFANGEFCNVIQKELAVVRAMTGLQAGFVNQFTPPVDLCEEIPFEVVVKNVGIASHFMQEFCLYLPKEGMQIVPSTVCFAHPDTIVSLGSPGTYMPIDDAFVSIVNPDTIINGQPSKKISIDMNAFASSLGVELELPGSTFPENNENKYRFKWKVLTDCDFISGSKLFSEAFSVDACDEQLLSSAESSNIVPIRGLDPRDYNRNQVYLLDTMLGACLDNQIITANVVSFPNQTGPNEFVCITFPAEVTVNASTPFNPSTWMMSPLITPVAGGNEYCWEIPAGTPPGVLAFNLDLSVDEESECGMLDFATYTKVSDEAVCITTGESCTLEIFTSELEASAVEVIPAIKIIDSQISATASCSPSGNLMTETSVAIQNQSGDIAVGTSVAVTIFSDDNGNGSLDPGEELAVGNYTDGLASSQIGFVAVSFVATLDQMCKLYAVAGGNDCACTADAEAIDPGQFELDICTDVPLVCLGGQTGLLCDDLPTGGFSLQWSSLTDPELEYLNTSSGIFGPAPVGIQTYEVTMNLGDGCKVSGDCSIQVIGELGEFTITGEPSCVDEVSKCTIELEPICNKDILSEASTDISCASLTASFQANRSTFFSYSNNSVNVGFNGPETFNELNDWVENFNDSIKIVYQDFGNEICIQNDFGLEQTVYAVPLAYDDGLNVSEGSCSLVRGCFLIAQLRYVLNSGDLEVTYMTPCGTFTDMFSYTSYSDLETQTETWFNTTISAAVGGNYDLTASSGGISLVTADGIMCDVDGVFSITSKNNTRSGTFTYLKECEANCEEGGVQFRISILDLNGNEIPEPASFCCSEVSQSFAFTNSSIVCRRTSQLFRSSTRLNLSDELDSPNPLNDILLYSWEAENGDVISQEGNCAYLRWNEVGTYEVCATPLLSPDSGLDCDIPPVCKDHEVVEDDIRANVSVNEALTCNEVSSVTIALEDPTMIQSVTICDENGTTIFSEQMDGCPGLVSSLNLISEDCDLGEVCNAIPHSDVMSIDKFYPEGYWIFQEGTACTSFIEDGSADLTLLDENNIVQSCGPGFGFNTDDFSWDANTSTETIDEFLLNFLTENAANFFDDKSCGLTGFTVEECDGYVTLSGLPANSLFIFKVAYESVGGFNEEAYLIFGDKPSTVASSFTEILSPGDYTAKIEGAICGDMAEYPFTLPDPPSDEVLSTMMCNNTSACAIPDGSILATGQTNGIIDSLVLCDASGTLEVVDYTMESPPLFMVENTFTDLSVGTYTIKVYSECGETQQTCDINSSADFVTTSDSEVMQYTDCASDDAQISMTVESNNPIDSIIWCGPMGMIIKDQGPHVVPYAATTGSGILYGTWTAKVYTACANTQDVFNIQAPPPGSATEVTCEGIAPLSCLETFGSLDLAMTYTPSGFAPDSVVLSSPGGLHLVDATGSLAVSFAPLIPGTYAVQIYTWDACNNQTIECVVPEPDDQAVISSIDAPVLPCAKLFPDSLSSVVVNYATDPSSLDIVRVDWYKGSVATGTLVNTNINPGSSSDVYDILAGEEGDYCVVIIGGDAGLFSTCPRDTLCFTVTASDCPSDCALVVDSMNFIQRVDCTEGSVFDFDIVYDATGCVVEEGLAAGTGFIKVELLDTASGTFKGLNSSQLPVDTLSCTDVRPGTYMVIVSYIENGSIYCMETFPVTLLDAATLEYTIEVDIVPTPCNAEVGKVTVTTITDNFGNSHPLTNFNFVLLDGFTPIANIMSPAVPTFCDLMTGLYTVELSSVTSDCEVASVGAIIPNGDAEALCPNSILPSNNCGPCDGVVIMPNTLGIIYRMQDAMGNLIFPQAAPNDHIFVDVCAGEYQIIAFDLSLDDPSECPAICETEVPISENGFSIALDTITGSPCEASDGRILVMAVNGNCSYNYELYSVTGVLISDTPILNPSANACADKSDMMMFLGLEPGTYKVIGWATDNEGNSMSCMDMDTIVLRDNDIKHSLDDVYVMPPLCDGDDAVICLLGVLEDGQTLEVRDEFGNPVPSMPIGRDTVYCSHWLDAGDYEIRITAGEGIFNCTEIIDVVIEDPDVLECNAVPLDPSDCIEEDGSIAVTINGGAPGYEIVWDDATIVGFNPMNLPVGQYAFEISDANGCTKRDTAELKLPFCNEPCPEIIEEFAVVDAECGESNGNMFVTVQGQAMYSYEWDTGATGQELTNLAAGIYCVTITSLNNPVCIYEACQEVDEIDGPVVSGIVADATCDTDGSITLDISGGTPAYALLWEDPDGNSTGPITLFGEYIINGSAGIYNMTITDAEGCQNLLQAEIKREDGLQVIGTIDQFPSCTQNTGEITISSVNGNFPFDFYVNDILYSSSNSNMVTVPNLGPGAYLISVMDSDGCQGESSVTLVTGGGPVIDPDDWSVVPAICSGDDGHIVYAGGGGANVIYKIFQENSTIPLGQVTADMGTTFEVPLGGYYISCEDLNTGCTDVLDDMEVIGPEPLDYIVQYHDPADCENLGSISIVDITGGYDVAELSITITDGGTNVYTDLLQTPMELLAGSYVITVCHEGTDSTTTCCKERTVTLEGIASCCESLAGEIFYDDNENGCQDAGESLVMENVLVSLYACGSIPGTDAPTAITVVDDGAYEFSTTSEDVGAAICLQAGAEYFVVFDIPDGEAEMLQDYTVTSGIADATCETNGASDDVDMMTVSSECYDPSDDDSTDMDEDEHIDLGIVPACERIAGEIFYDINDNGCQDTGDKLVTEAVNITLYTCGDVPGMNVPVATTTVTDGDYEFGPESTDEGAVVCLSPGTKYFVVFDLPNAPGEALEGYDFSSNVAEAACEAAGESDDVDPSTGMSDCYDPDDDDTSDDDHDENMDAGITPICESLAGEIYYDNNDNGCQDAGETLVTEAINVSLYECGDMPGSDTPLATVTFIDGDYEFGPESTDVGGEVCLEAGTKYFVVFDIPNAMGESLEAYEFSSGVADASCVMDGESDDVNPDTGISECYDPDDDDQHSDDDEDIDAGIRPPCHSLAGQIFYDGNENGCQDSGETLVTEAVTVTLYTCGDEPGAATPVGSTMVTDGDYEFSQTSPDAGAEVCLEAGTEYFVVFDIPNAVAEALEDYTFTTGMSEAACVADGESDDVNPFDGTSDCYDPDNSDDNDRDADENIDAGIVAPCEQLSGEIFYDYNNNGCEDPGDGLVMEAVAVILYECGDIPGVDSPVASTTVSDGMYAFGQTSDDLGAQVCLEAGTEYFVVFDIPNDSGEALEGSEFSDGTANPACATAGESDDVSPDNGQSDCYDADNDDPDGDDDEDIDVGIVPACESLAGEIFYDDNNNGCEDAGETLVTEAVNVSLYKCGDLPGINTPFAITTITDGTYEFGQESPDAGADVCLVAGKGYFVVFDIPDGSGEALEGYEFSTSTASGSCATSGEADDINAIDGSSSCYDPVEEDDDEDIDAGITPKCETIGGEIFYDINNNGCEDPGETLVAEEITVHLYECGAVPGVDVALATTMVTDGDYEFGPDSPDEGAVICLDPDAEYFILFDIPNEAGESLEGSMLSTGTADATCVATGESDDVDPVTGLSACVDPEDDDDDKDIDVGIVPPCEDIAGEIFYDGNDNGCQDAGETLVMEDITITLYICGDVPGVDSPVASTTVNDGLYEFSEDSEDEGADICLKAGTEYFVVFNIPNSAGEVLENYEFSSIESDATCEAAGESDDVDPTNGQSDCVDPDYDDDDDDDNHLDVGIVPPCEQLAGEIFYDGNENGCQDAGEALVQETVTVTLYTCGDVPGTATPVAMTTVSDGMFAFGLTSDDPGAQVCLDAGTAYFVVFDIPNDAGEVLENYEVTTGTADATCIAVGDSDDVNVLDNTSECYDPDNDDSGDEDDDEHIDIGIVPPCEQMAGEIFYDLNNNGCEDSDETLVTEDITVTLYECGEELGQDLPIASTIVSDGVYNFGLASDDKGAQVCLDEETEYFVVFDFPIGSGEVLDDHTPSTCEASRECEVSGESDDVDPMTLSSECHDPDDDDGDDDEDIDIGIVPPCYEVAGQIFYDDNYNGCQDSGEALVMTSVVVSLYECGTEPGMQLPVAVTSVVDGDYSFSENSTDPGAGVCLEPNTEYFIVFNLPNGTGETLENYEFTNGTADLTCESASESDDVDPLTGISSCYDPDNDDPNDNDDDEHIDAGIVSTCHSLAGEIFYDSDNNGCQDPGESLVITSVNVTLYECGDEPGVDAPVATTTVSDGDYVFGMESTDPDASICLKMGVQYFVVFDIPNGVGETLEDYSFSMNNASAICLATGLADDVNSTDGTSGCYDPYDNDTVDDDEDEHIDAGIVPCEQIGGTVFYDLDNNGCQAGAEETGVENVFVYIFTCDEIDPKPGNAISSTVTDEDGNYEFSNTEAGGEICLIPEQEYFVLFDLPGNPGQSLAGYDFSTEENPSCGDSADADDVDSDTGLSDCYDPEDEDDDEDIDVGIYPCQQLGGEAFYDLNNNGCQEDGESAVIEEITVNLYICDDAGASIGEPIAKTTTGDDGQYGFGPFEGGEAQICLDPNVTYLVEFVLPNGAGEVLDNWNFTSNESEACGDSADTVDIDPATGQSDCYNPEDEDDDEDIDVGIYPCQQLGGEVFYDLNNNGCQEDGEGLVTEDVTVNLYACGDNGSANGAAVATSSTGNDGIYAFGPDEAGSAQICLDPSVTYVVEFVLPNGMGEVLENWNFTSNDSEVCVDSADRDDIDPETGQSDCYNPDDDDDDEDIDLGIYPCQELGGEVFYDLNNNGCQEDGEGLVTEDVTVNLYVCGDNGSANGAAVATSSTGNDGIYAFGPDEAGSAQICLDPSVTYVVEFVLPNGAGDVLEKWNFTSNDSETCGDNADTDDIDPATGQSDCYNPDDDDDDEDIDVGIRLDTVDVALIKTTTQVGPFRYGDKITFDIQVFNQGNVDLYEIKVNDFIPCGYKYLSSNSGIWGYNPFSSIATTIIEHLEPGATVSVPIILEISPCNQPDAWLNIAEVESFEDEDGVDITDQDIDSDGDDDPDNDVTLDNSKDNQNGDEDDNDPESVEVFDLALIKELVTSGPYYKDNVVEFKITVVNQGNVAGANIRIADHLPIGYSYDAALNPGWDDSAAPIYFYEIPGVLYPKDTVCIAHKAIIEYVDRTLENYTNIAEISRNTAENGGPVTDADSSPDDDKDNDGTPVDNQMNDKGDEDDHDPEVINLTQDLPPDCFFECQLSCIHEINLSLDNSDCMTEVGPSNFIAGLDPACDDDDFYTLMLTDEYGNDIDPTVITADHIGQQITFKITNECANSCWGYINVESKQGPAIDCPPLLVTNCFAYDIKCPPHPVELLPSCNGLSAEVTLHAESFEFIDCGTYTMEILRTYRAVNELGYESFCDQRVLLERFDLDDLVYPIDAAISCGDTTYQYDANGIPLPWLPELSIGRPSGVPLLILDELPERVCSVNRFMANQDSTAFMLPLEQDAGVTCNGNISYSDIEVEKGECKRKIMRTWNYYEWSCGELIEDNMVQVIELLDNEAPEITCPSDTIINAMFDCGIQIELPAATATDDCNAELRFTVTHPSGFSFENGGMSELPLGESTLTYIVYDGCDNSSSCNAVITAVDESLPVAVCDQNTVITINSSGNVRVPAIVFDDGSLDACDELVGCVTRMDELEFFDQIPADTFFNYIKYVEKSKMEFTCAQDEVSGVVLDGMEYVSAQDLCRPFAIFCCGDAAQNLMVRFQVKDPAGNASQCMVNAQIKDVGLPQVTCPDDMKINCTADLSDLAADFGDAELLGNCGGVYPVLETQVDERNVCGLGDLTRVFTFEDQDGIVLGTCSQTLTIEVVQVFSPDDVIWPEDFSVECSTDFSDLNPDSLAVAIGYPILPEGCYLLGVEYEDDFFAYAQDSVACGKIVRKWTLLDWCDGQDGEFTTYQYSQLIEVRNETAPVLIGLYDLQLYSTMALCDSVDVVMQGIADDDCTPVNLLQWSYLIIAADGTQQQGSGSEIAVRLPLGIHQVIWTVEDACGNKQNDTQTIILSSNIPATPKCNSNLSLPLEEAWKNVKIPTSLIDQGTLHPCGDEYVLSFHPIEIQDTLTLTCDDLGANTVTLYAQNVASDTTSTCTTVVTITDPDDYCAGQLVVIEGNIITEKLQAIEQVEVSMGAGYPMEVTSTDGNYAFEDMLLGGNYRIEPYKNDDHLNGVSTLDLILIQRHILGIEELQGPYERIAADVNMSDNINGIDLIELRKLILGIYDELPDNTSWRFIDEAYQFTQQDDPWRNVFPESYDILDLDSDMDIDFIGVKIGDVNGDVEASQLDKKVRNRDGRWPLVFEIMEQKISKGEVVSIPVSARNYERISGWQGTFNFDPTQIEILGVGAGALKFDESNINPLQVTEGKLPFSYSFSDMEDYDEAVLFELVVKARAEVSTVDLFSLSSEVTKLEAYRGYREIVGVQLDYELQKNVEIKAVTPNPWINEAAIQFYLPEAGEGRWEFHNSTGKLLFSTTEQYKAGDQNFIVSSSQLSTNGLVYAKLITKWGTTEFRMMVLK